MLEHLQNWHMGVGFCETSVFVLSGLVPVLQKLMLAAFSTGMGPSGVGTTRLSNPPN